MEKSILIKSDHKGSEKVSDAEMLRLVLEEVRYVRQRLDTHIEDEDDSVKSMRQDISTIREEMSGHRVKIGLMLAGVGVAITSLFGWMVKHIDKISS